MIIAGWLSRFPSPKENLPITLHHHIDYLHFSDLYLNLMYGTINRNLNYSTLYRINLIG